MISTNKYKKTIVFLLTVWLLVFVGLSTSHMGNNHHLHFPDNNINKNISNPSEQVIHSHCSWTHATTMTIGGPVVQNDYSHTPYVDFIVFETYQQWISNLLGMPDPRGPPV